MELLYLFLFLFFNSEHIHLLFYLLCYVEISYDTLGLVGLVENYLYTRGGCGWTEGKLDPGKG